MCCYCYSVHNQVQCLVEHGAVLERADNSATRGSDRTAGCQNPALVASLLKKASKTGINSTITAAVQQLIQPLGTLYYSTTSKMCIMLKRHISYTSLCYLYQAAVNQERDSRTYMLRSDYCCLNLTPLLHSALQHLQLFIHFMFSSLSPSLHHLKGYRSAPHDRSGTGLCETSSR